MSSRSHLPVQEPYSYHSKVALIRIIVLESFFVENFATERQHRMVSTSSEMIPNQDERLEKWCRHSRPRGEEDDQETQERSSESSGTGSNWSTEIQVEEQDTCFSIGERRKRLSRMNHQVDVKPSFQSQPEQHRATVDLYKAQTNEVWRVAHTFQGGRTGPCHPNTTMAEAQETNNRTKATIDSPGLQDEEINNKLKANFISDHNTSMELTEEGHDRVENPCGRDGYFDLELCTQTVSQGTINVTPSQLTSYQGSRLPGPGNAPSEGDSALLELAAETYCLEDTPNRGRSLRRSAPRPNPVKTTDMTMQKFRQAHRDQQKLKLARLFDSELENAVTSDQETPGPNVVLKARRDLISRTLPSGTIRNVRTRSVSRDAVSRDSCDPSSLLTSSIWRASNEDRDHSRIRRNRECVQDPEAEHVDLSLFAWMRQSNGRNDRKLEENELPRRTQYESKPSRQSRIAQSLGRAYPTALLRTVTASMRRQFGGFLQVIDMHVQGISNETVAPECDHSSTMKVLHDTFESSMDALDAFHAEMFSSPGPASPAQMSADINHPDADDLVTLDKCSPGVFETSDMDQITGLNNSSATQKMPRRTTSASPNEPRHSCTDTKPFPEHSLGQDPSNKSRARKVVATKKKFEVKSTPLLLENCLYDCPFSPIDHTYSTDEESYSGDAPSETFRRFDIFPKSHKWNESGIDTSDFSPCRLKKRVRASDTERQIFLDLAQVSQPMSWEIAKKARSQEDYDHHYSVSADEFSHEACQDRQSGAGCIHGRSGNQEGWNQGWNQDQLPLPVSGSTAENVIETISSLSNDSGCYSSEELDSVSTTSSIRARRTSSLGLEPPRWVPMLTKSTASLGLSPSPFSYCPIISTPPLHFTEKWMCYGFEGAQSVPLSNQNDFIVMIQQDEDPSDSPPRNKRKRSEMRDTDDGEQSETTSSSSESQEEETSPMIRQKQSTASREEPPKSGQTSKARVSSSKISRVSRELLRMTSMPPKARSPQGPASRQALAKTRSISAELETSNLMPHRKVTPEKSILKKGVNYQKETKGVWRFLLDEAKAKRSLNLPRRSSEPRMVLRGVAPSRSPENSMNANHDGGVSPTSRTSHPSTSQTLQDENVLDNGGNPFRRAEEQSGRDQESQVRDDDAQYTPTPVQRMLRDRRESRLQSLTMNRASEASRRSFGRSRERLLVRTAPASCVVSNPHVTSHFTPTINTAPARCDSIDEGMVSPTTIPSCTASSDGTLRPPPYSVLPLVENRGPQNPVTTSDVDRFSQQRVTTMVQPRSDSCTADENVPPQQSVQRRSLNLGEDIPAWDQINPATEGSSRQSLENNQKLRSSWGSAFGEKVANVLDSSKRAFASLRPKRTGVLVPVVNWETNYAVPSDYRPSKVRFWSDEDGELVGPRDEIEGGTSADGPQSAASPVLSGSTGSAGPSSSQSPPDVSDTSGHETPETQSQPRNPEDRADS